MASKGPLRGLMARLLLAALFALMPSWLARAQATQEQKSFSTRDAAALLNQINDALVDRAPDRFLAAFNLSRMRDGQLFRQQISSFLSHAESIRLHFNLTGVNMDGNQGTATVDAEMEVDTGNGEVPLHKQATLSFAAEQMGSGWKFIDVQPRSFFSTSAASAASSSLSP